MISFSSNGIYYPSTREEFQERIEKQELKDYTITTCGSSAGGYMVALMGAMLNAERIIDSSGQFNLWIHNNPGIFVEKYNITI